MKDPHDCINIHLTYVPYLKAAGEVKTKPTQHSVQMLREHRNHPRHDFMPLRKASLRRDQRQNQPLLQRPQRFCDG